MFSILFLHIRLPGTPDAALRHRISYNACPGFGSCGGMFTYNTMQTFIGVVGMQPLHMVAPASDDPRRLDAFPAELVQIFRDDKKRPEAA